MTTRLQKINPAKNMARFYHLDLQPDLFGGVQLVRSWGRLGTEGQYMTQHFDNMEAANKQLELLERVKRRGGYL